MPAANRILDVYNKLKIKGIEVYLPAIKTGEAKTKYVVVKDQGSEQFEDYSSTRNVLDVMCYVPQNKYSELFTYVDEVKEIMKELKPMIKPTYSDTPAFYDDTIKGWMVSVEYVFYKKL